MFILRRISQKHYNDNISDVLGYYKHLLNYTQYRGKFIIAHVRTYA